MNYFKTENNKYLLPQVCVDKEFDSGLSGWFWLKVCHVGVVEMSS